MASRLRGFLIVWAAAIELVGCASVAPSGPPPLKAEEFLISSGDPGIQLYLRNKAPSGMKSFTGEKTLLFVHGATYPSETTFDLELDGVSWMDYVAFRGYDVYLLDIRGYGRSTRPPSMSQDPSANAPFATTADAVRDVSAAIDFILKHRGIAKLSLLGWSWGTTTTAIYTAGHNDRINKLILYAPVWTPPTVGTPPAPPTTAYRSVTMDAARQRWYRGVPTDQQGALIPAGWFDAWTAALLASDPEGARQTPPAIRAPNGVLADIFGQWLLGKRMYDAADIRVPTMLVKAEWDADTPAYMAQGLFENLNNAPYKEYLEVGQGTHMLMLEKNRMQLFRSVQSFLDGRAP